MARLKGIEAGEAGWFTGLIYGMVRRKMRQLTAQD
jgi:hypothetical protein